MIRLTRFRSMEHTPGYVTLYGYSDSGFVISTALDGGQKAILGDNGIQLVRLIKGNAERFFGRPVQCELTHDQYDEPFILSTGPPEPPMPSGFVYSPRLITIASSLMNETTSDAELWHDRAYADVYTLAETIEKNLNPNIKRFVDLDPP